MSTRRSFLSGVFGGIAAGGAGLIVRATPDEVRQFASTMPVRDPVMVAPRVVRATAAGAAFIVGIAAEDVRAGDVVQIQTHGPAQVNVR
jgi:hypothetical protein